MFRSLKHWKLFAESLWKSASLFEPFNTYWSQTYSHLLSLKYASIIGLKLFWQFAQNWNSTTGITLKTEQMISAAKPRLEMFLCTNKLFTNPDAVKAFKAQKNWIYTYRTMYTRLKYIIFIYIIILGKIT